MINHWREMASSKYLIAYLIVLHLALGLVLMKSDFLQRVRSYLGELPPELSTHYHSMLAYHSLMDNQAPEGAILFIGDSITQSLAVTNIAPKSINYGIGSDTTLGVLQRLGVYKSLGRAEVIVLAVGLNDLKRRDPDAIVRNYAQILKRLPQDAGVIISAIHPVDEAKRGPQQSNRRIRQVNQGLERLASSDPRWVYTDAGRRLGDSRGNLKPAYHVGDGVHLSAAGYAIWTEALKAAIDVLTDSRSDTAS